MRARFLFHGCTRRVLIGACNPIPPPRFRRPQAELLDRVGLSYLVAREKGCGNGWRHFGPNRAHSSAPAVTTPHAPVDPAWCPCLLGAGCSVLAHASVDIPRLVPVRVGR